LAANKTAAGLEFPAPIGDNRAIINQHGKRFGGIA